MQLWGFIPKAVPQRPEAREQCVPILTCKKTIQILLAHQPLHSSSSKCLNNVLIPSHFKPVCLSEDICSIFGNENKVSARFNLFLSQISPLPVLAHPNGTAGSLSFTPPHRTTALHNLHSCSKERHTLKISSNLHLTAFPQSWTPDSSWVTGLACKAEEVLGVYTVTKKLN